MNAQTHLISQGWLGPGHPLQPSRPDSLKKRLIVSQKLDTRGIGKQKHDAHADQWWLRAFDNALRDINVTSTNIPLQSSNVPTPVRSVGPRIETLETGKWLRNGGLYAGFVRGEGMKGTFSRGDILPALDNHASLEKKEPEARWKRKGDHPLSKGEPMKRKRMSLHDDSTDAEQRDSQKPAEGPVNEIEDAVINANVTEAGSIGDSLAEAHELDVKKDKKERRRKRLVKKTKKAYNLGTAAGLAEEEVKCKDRMNREPRARSKQKGKKHR